MEKRYIHSLDIHNLSSPDLIVPFIMKFVKPNSILDVGCGIGTWLKVFADQGIFDLLGIDGDYVDQEILQKFIEKDNFLSLDLRFSFDLKRQFDLVLSLEVAEHLEEQFSDVFVSNLVKHSDVIIFSAAIPGQGGQNHLNEQWPVYWAEKFAYHGYVFLDILRPLIWDNSNIDYWYRQNMFVVVKEDHDLAKKHHPNFSSLVHPELFERIQINSQKQLVSMKKQLAVHPLKRFIKSLISN